MALCATSSPPSSLDRMQNVIKEIGAEKQPIYTYITSAKFISFWTPPLMMSLLYASHV